MSTDVDGLPTEAEGDEQCDPTSVESGEEQFAPNLLEEMKRQGVTLPDHVDLSPLSQVTLTASEPTLDPHDVSGIGQNAQAIGIMASMPRGIFDLPDGPNAEARSRRTISAVLRSLSGD